MLKSADRKFSQYWANLILRSAQVNHATPNSTWPKLTANFRHQIESQFSFETATWSGSLRIMSSVPLKAGRGLMFGSLYLISVKFWTGAGKGRTTKSSGLYRSLGSLPRRPKCSPRIKMRFGTHHLRGRRRQAQVHHKSGPLSTRWNCSGQTGFLLDGESYHMYNGSLVHLWCV